MKIIFAVAYVAIVLINMGLAVYQGRWEWFSLLCLLMAFAGFVAWDSWRRR